MNENKCPKCYAVLEYNKERNKLQCKYCGSEYDLSHNNNFVNTYICNNCGFSVKSKTNISNCIYCSNNTFTVYNSNIYSGYILPFKIQKKEAIEKLKKLNKCKFLKPKEFKNKCFNNIVGIYVPYLLCDYDAIGLVEAECNIESNFKSDGYKYKKTDTYKAIRGGKMSLTNVPVVCSKHFKDNIFDEIYPFDYSEIKSIDDSNKFDYLIENSSYSKTDLINLANNKAKEIFKKEIKNDIIGYNNVKFTDDSINLNNLKSIYVLLPVWLLNIKYKNTIYTFALNGQTGKLTGIVPKSLKKIICLFIYIFITIFVILFILNYFKVML